jgi:tryptophan synthase alpha chain
MGRLVETFERLRAQGERALIPFVCAGDPDLATTEAVVLAAAESGADAVEIGVPFSDPIAEGPTIQRASERALRGGVNLRRILELTKSLRTQLDIPLLLMGYANPFLALGEQYFVELAREAGVDGLVVADLPPEEGETLFSLAEEGGIDPVMLAAPTTTPGRLAKLSARTRGFLYYVSLTGVTGARRELPPELEGRLRTLRRSLEVPICVGFGVSTPQQAAAIGRCSDGVIVGSALVDRIASASSAGAAAEEAGRFVAALKAPLREPVG